MCDSRSTCVCVALAQAEEASARLRGCWQAALGRGPRLCGEGVVLPLRVWGRGDVGDREEYLPDEGVGEAPPRSAPELEGKGGGETKRGSVSRLHVFIHQQLPPLPPR